MAKTATYLPKVNSCVDFLTILGMEQTGPFKIQLLPLGFSPFCLWIVWVCHAQDSHVPCMSSVLEKKIDTPLSRIKCQHENCVFFSGLQFQMTCIGLVYLT